MMVLFRVIQGICGAALVPLSQAVLLDINPREKHGQAMAIWGAGIMVGPIAGPVLGGWLTDAFNWRWAFYVNLPVGLLALLGMLVYLPKSQRRQRGFDFFGFAMLSLAVGALQMMLDRGDQLDWFSSAEIWLELGLAISGAWAFVIHTATAEHPFLDPHIFRDRNLTTGAAADLHGRRHPARRPRADAADAAEHSRLSGDHRRHRARAARRRHDDLDDPRRAARADASTRASSSSAASPSPRSRFGR